MADPKEEARKARALTEVYKELNNAIEEQLGNLNSAADANMRNRLISEQIANNQKIINELVKVQVTGEEDVIEELNEISQKQRELIVNTEKHNTRIAETKRRYDSLSAGVQKLWGFLNENDKIIRQTILNLGMSGTKAEMMRSSFEQSALYAAKLGGGLEDVQTVMTGFAEETGRARALSDEMVKSVLAIGKGTGLGVEQATKLAAQFEFMGVDAENAMTLVQGVVDTSERMGVNTTKVLKTVTDNFKKLSTFTFQGGVKAFGQMAADAEKTRVSMATALNVAEATRGLEQVIELGANLQVMGGRFAEMDPFQWLYMARNEPDKMNEKISEMTKGIYTFKKNSEGLFEKAISPADRDRLSQVAKSLGISQEEMFEIAQRRLDLDTMDKQLAGAGLNKTQRELIQGAATFDAKSGRFQVMLGGTMRDISTLTKDQAEAFVKEQATLEERAKQAQTFDEAFKATINELKSILLPMLQGVKKILDGARPIFEKITGAIDKFSKGGFGTTVLKGAGLLMASGFILVKVWNLAAGVFTGLKSLPAAMGSMLSKFTGKGGSILGGTTGGGTAGGAGGGFGAGAGAGLKGLGKGAGAGAAMAGAGAGIMLAAKGLSELADSMSKLTPEQAKSLATIATTMAITFPLAAIGIALVAGAATSGAIGLLALGAALLMVGGGIALASLGIGRMALGLAELNKSGTGAGKQLLGVAGGVAAITGIMFSGGIPALFAFNNSLARMSKNAGGIERVGGALTAMKLALTGSVDDFVAVSDALSSIGKINIRGGGALADLASILRNPLKVEFADKRVAMVSDITLNIDGERFTEKTIRYDALVEHSERARSGLRSR